MVVFPELCITSYSCADLFYNRDLLDGSRFALLELAEACRDCGVAAVFGLPIRVDGKLYNVAAIVDSHGLIRGFVPKTYLPSTNEFYEPRWFTRGDFPTPKEIFFEGHDIPFGTDLLFPVHDFPDAVIGLEICEDLWAALPPSSFLAVAGATMVLNPSASPEILGKRTYRRDLVRQQSARTLSVYAYAGAGPGESTTDVVYSGHCLLAENGGILAESDRFQFDSQMVIADVDLGKIAHERIKNSSFAQTPPNRAFRRETVHFKFQSKQRSLRRDIDRFPFVPSDTSRRAENCREIFEIQSTGLAKRLLHTKAKTIVIGVSGGLDSTLALLVATHAADRIGLERTCIQAITMPGFGTTSRTKSNAVVLSEELGTSLQEIPIGAACSSHLRDIGHSEDARDVTYENVQARERTQVLMDIANKTGGLVLGTGDLSELALGWCTYNGDHMSMYHVNAGVPKSLVRYLIEWCAQETYTGKVSSTLRDICETPISPELLPPGEGGEISQKTEQVVGPYELHDFFLFHFVRNGFSAEKILFLSQIAFQESYKAEEIFHWLGVFFQRFYSQQFKRSCMPDGPKVGSVALSPRGDWRMPSDAHCPAELFGK